jgi:putative endonuclease
MKSIGQLGERIACQFLLANNYTLLKKNFTTRFGEIDIIAQHNQRIHIIEVKLQTGRIPIHSGWKIGQKKKNV